MPFVKVNMNEKFRSEADGIGDAIHSAMVDSIGIPDGDFFQAFQFYSEGELRFDRSFFDIQRSDRFLIIEITLAKGRSSATKAQLYDRIARRIAERTSITTSDVFIILNGVDLDDLSFGDGKAQFVENMPDRLRVLQTKSNDH